MDKLAPAIEWFKKNGFWVGCGLVALLMIGMWHVTTGAIDDETDSNTSKINTSISSANGLLKKSATEVEGIVAHPNTSTKEGMKVEMEQTIDAIVKAWKKREADQKEVLVWPKAIPNDRFVEIFAKFNPPELFPKDWEGGFGLEPYLELYAARIPDHMSKLCGDELLRTRWNFDPKYQEEEEIPSGMDEEEGYGGFGGGGPALDQPEYDPNEYAVLWADKNQELWHSKLTEFQMRDDNQREINAPTPLQCYMLQQDLWLLEAMFKIIREVNGDSSANDLSKIKKIDHVAFGRLAGKDLGSLTPVDKRLGDPAALATGRDMFDEDMMDEYMDEYSGDEDMEGMDGMGMQGLFVGQVPYDERYVDTNFQPLAAEVVRGVINGTDIPQANLELMVAKRVPVRIALRMDERVIPDFMAACANSEFAFEIQQVRWNKHTPGGGDIDIAAIAAGGGGARAGMGNSAMAGGGMFGGGGPGSSDQADGVETRVNFDVNVEFYGIVKIYNPVQEDLLRRAAGLEVKQPGATANATAPGSAETQP